MDYKIIENITDIGSFQKDLEVTKFISLDTETTGLDTLTDKIVLLQIKINGNIYIFNYKKFGEKYTKYIIELLQASEKPCIIQNAKFDLKIIKSNTGILLEKIYCTQVTEVLITNGLSTRFPSLEELLKKYENVSIDKDIRLDFTNPDLILEKKHYDYSALDVEYLESIMEKQMEQVKASKQLVTHELEMKFTPVLAQMELNGVPINKNKWKEVVKSYEKKSIQEKENIKKFFINEINFGQFSTLLDAVESIGITKNKEGESLKTKRRKEELQKITDVNLSKNFIYKSINIDSNAQIKNLLILSGIKVTNTLAGTLKDLYNKHPITKNIVDYREYNRRVTTYGEEFLSRIHPLTRRIHANYKQMGTASGRLACDEPNMQNIPAEDEYRSSFESESGKKFITIDYSQQEYRIIGELTGEPKIKDAYNADTDLHAVTASLIFDLPINEINKEQRDLAKMVNFALFYGANEYSLKHRLGITLKEARRIIIAIFEGMPRFVSYRAAFENQVVKHMYSVTMTGRRRYFKERTDFLDGPDYSKYIGRIKREGFNHPVQGTGADMTKLAMCYCHYRNPFGDKFKLVTQGHDEIGFEVEENIAEEALEFASKQMILAGEKFIKTMPVKVEGTIKNCWSKG